MWTALFERLVLHFLEEGRGIGTVVCSVHDLRMMMVVAIQMERMFARLARFARLRDSCDRPQLAAQTGSHRTLRKSNLAKALCSGSAFGIATAAGMHPPWGLSVDPYHRRLLLHFTNSRYPGRSLPGYAVTITHHRNDGKRTHHYEPSIRSSAHLHHELSTKLMSQPNQGCTNVTGSSSRKHSKAVQGTSTEFGGQESSATAWHAFAF